MRKPLRIILLSGVLLFGFMSQCFNAELGAQYDSKHEQTMSRFAFAPLGFGVYLAERIRKNRKVILARDPAEAPLTVSPSATSANPSTVSSRTGVGRDNNIPIRVRVINRALSGYSKAPADISSYGVNMPESRKPPGAVKAARVQEAEPYSATSSWLANEPSEAALTTIVNVDHGKSRLLPKVAKPRRVSVRSRRSRARARRPSIPTGQPLISDMPKWAREALFKSGE